MLDGSVINLRGTKGVSEGAQTILCAISSTYDYPTGKQSGPTTGEDVFTFSAQPDGSIAVGSVEGCTKMTQFIASDSEYFIACDFVTPLYWQPSAEVEIPATSGRLGALAVSQESRLAGAFEREPKLMDHCVRSFPT